MPTASDPGRRLAGVHKQIDDHLLEPVPVAQHAGQPGLQVQREVAALEQPLALEKFDGGGHRAVEVGLAWSLEPRPARAALRPGVVEQSLHNAIDPANRDVHLRRDVGIAAPLPQDLDVGAEGAERIPDLVGHARGEAAEPGQLLHADDVTVHVEQLFGHAAVPRRQLGELRWSRRPPPRRAMSPPASVSASAASTPRGRITRRCTT